MALPIIKRIDGRRNSSVFRAGESAFQKSEIISCKGTGK